MLNTERMLSHVETLPFVPHYWDERRRYALTRVLENGLPSTKVESFKYTDVRKFLNNDLAFKKSGENSEASEKAIKKVVKANTLEGIFTVVIVDGEVDFEASRAPEGLQVASIASALDVHDDRIKPYLDGTALGKTPHFRDLNTALASDGVVVFADESCEAPVHCLWVNTGVEVHTRLLVIANANVHVVETFSGTGAGFTNHMSEFFAQKQSVIEHSVIQNLSADESLVRRADASCDEGSQYLSRLCDIGGKAVRHDVNVRLRGKGARAEAMGAYVLGGAQHNDIHLRCDHVAPECESHQAFYGVLSEKSRGVFDGLAYIHKDAQKSHAEQKNHNLLLSRDAEIDTKPELEIFADDVTCAHGATVGQLDEKALFYLKSRGIAADDARAILTRAFVAKGTDVFAEGVREQVEALVAAKLDASLDNKASS